MPRGFKLMVPFANWPADDRSRFQDAVRERDRFDEGPPGARLSPSTRRNRQQGYGRFLRFLTDTHPDLLALPPEARINRELVVQYVWWRRGHCSEISVAADLFNLHGMLQLFCPSSDWKWLLGIAKRIAAAAPRQSPKHHLVTSEQLYALGIELMEGAAADAAAEGLNEAHARQYRDGLLIALLALTILRRRSVAAVRVGRELVKVGDLWHLAIAASDTKNRRPLDFVLLEELSGHIDRYLGRFRDHIPGAHRHDGLWPSKEGRPMCADVIYKTIRKRTKKAFGFPIKMHRFRHAAMALWSIRDPENLCGVKDLFGHASFAMTEQYRPMAQSRLAGRVLARAIDNVLGEGRF
jgi:integrase/recombinase XerD